MRRLSLVTLAALLLSFATKVAYSPAAAQTATYSGGSIYDLKPPMRQSTSNRHLEALILSKRQHRMKEIREYPARGLYRRLARPVGRLAMAIRIRGGDEVVGYCTVSLIDKSLILTNYHCIAGNDEGRVTDALLWMGFVDSRHTKGVRKYGVELKPVEASQSLDYAIHKVRGQPGKDWGTISLGKSVSLYDRQSLFIIHHPAGVRQHISLGNCQAGHPATEGNDLLHVCDTIGGSSGAPVFDSETRKVVGLHYSAVDVGSLNAAKRMDKLIEHSPILQRLAIGIFREPIEPVRRQRKPYEPETVLISGGTFMMGCVSGKECDDSEKPVHRVTVSKFYMSKYETTFAQWDTCVRDGGCKHKPKDRGWGRGNRPVIYVSWDDANEYARWLSDKTGETWRLPTEAQWEYAARGDKDGRNKTKYSWGNKINCRKANYGNGWDESCKSVNPSKTKTVGSYGANGFGLHDMHGNVWEWVSDWYGKHYYKSSPAKNPKGAKSGSYRVMRGGCWNNRAWHLRSAFRSPALPVNRYFHIGFRLMRQPS